MHRKWREGTRTLLSRRKTVHFQEIRSCRTGVVTLQPAMRPAQQIVATVDGTLRRSSKSKLRCFASDAQHKMLKKKPTEYCGFQSVAYELPMPQARQLSLCQRLALTGSHKTEELTIPRVKQHIPQTEPPLHGNTMNSANNGATQAVYKTACSKSCSGSSSRCFESPTCASDYA